MNKHLMIFFVLLAALPVSAHAERPAGNPLRDKAKAYGAQQKAENESFRKGLKDVPKEARPEAIIAHRNKQFEENLAHHAQIHQKHMSELKSRLDANSNLSDAEKTKILNEAEQKYQQKIALARTRHQENIQHAQGIHNDPNLTPAQKKAKMNEHFEKNRAEIRADKMGYKAERAAKKEEWKEKKRQSIGEPKANK